MSHCLLLVLLLSTVSHWLLKKRSIKDFPPHHYCGRVPLWDPMLRCTVYYCFALLSLFITCPWLLSTAFTKLKEMISTVLLCFLLLCTIFHCFSQFYTVFYCVMQSIKLFFSLHSILLSSTVHCTKLFCTVMYRVLHFIKLHSLTVLHCIDCFFSFTLVYTVLYFHPLCTALNCTWPLIYSFALFCKLCYALFCCVLFYSVESTLH